MSDRVAYSIAGSVCFAAIALPLWAVYFVLGSANVGDETNTGILIIWFST